MILKICGNVLYVLEGKVNQANMRPITGFRYALGCASASDAAHAGEAIVLEGVSYAGWVEGGQLHCARAVSSPFLAGIDEKAPVEGLPIHTITSPISLEELYQALAKEYTTGVALVGSFHMAVCEATYVQKAPIFGENINEHHGTYWAPVEKLAGALVCCFGLIMPPGSEKHFAPSLLHKAFYHNPMEKGGAPFDSHTHTALVDGLRTAASSSAFLHTMKTLKVSGVRHMLPSSIAESGTYLLFPIDEIKAG
jgi:hypothetical protein